MKKVYELEVYQLAEDLSDFVWNDFDKWEQVSSRQYAVFNHQFIEK
ncbi:MAG: hypothetical protein J7L46_04780 [Bacteroidales bacterium]|nr:hypothetical protein [Bacteroidales bacterium]